MNGGAPLATPSSTPCKHKPSPATRGWPPPPRKSLLGRFFGVYSDPRAYLSMAYMLLALGATDATFLIGALGAVMAGYVLHRLFTEEGLKLTKRDLACAAGLLLAAAAMRHAPIDAPINCNGFTPFSARVFRWSAPSQSLNKY